MQFFSIAVVTVLSVSAISISAVLELESSVLCVTFGAAVSNFTIPYKIASHLAPSLGGFLA